MKKILVTGATGFVGANLVRRLVDENYQVYILKRKNSNIWRIKDLISKISTFDIDLLEKQRLFKLVHKIKPRVIFHLANLGLYGGQDSSIEESIKVNLLGTVNLIKSLDTVNYECFINTGSSSEYGTKVSPIKENDLCEPSTNYALSKLAGTIYAQAYAKQNKKPLATLRLFSPFGPFDHPSRFITQTILKMFKNGDILIKNPNTVRDYIYVEDVVNAYLICMQNPHKLSGEIFNIGMGKQICLKDVLKLLIKKIGSKSKIFYENSIKNENMMWQADIKKAKTKLGWYPKKNLIRGFTETIKWFKENLYFYG